MQDPSNTMNIDFLKTDIDGVYIIEQSVFSDARGFFVKTFHDEVFMEHGLEHEFRESYYSESVKNVVRGMHFQVPEHDHAKIATVIVGEIIDVIVDLRKGSSTFGQYITVDLTRENRRSVYIPRGCAHGFGSLSEKAVVHYMQTSVYSADHDKGIRWDSFGFDWPINKPIMSERDKNLPSLESFVTPF